MHGIKQLFLALAAVMAQATTSPAIAVGHEIQTHGMADLKIAGKLEDKFEPAIATRNDEPLLGRIFQAAIDALPQDQRNEILNRWLAVRYEQGFSSFSLAGR
jgi:hypothetical protein